jgi:hypothetical protein
MRLASNDAVHTQPTRQTFDGLLLSEGSDRVAWRRSVDIEGMAGGDACSGVCQVRTERGDQIRPGQIGGGGAVMRTMGG